MEAGLAAPHSHRHRRGRAVEAPGDVCQRLQGGEVRPLGVVDDQQQGRGHGQVDGEPVEAVLDRPAFGRRPRPVRRPARRAQRCRSATRPCALDRAAPARTAGARRRRGSRARTRRRGRAGRASLARAAVCAAASSSEVLPAPASPSIVDQAAAAGFGGVEQLPDRRELLVPLQQCRRRRRHAHRRRSYAASRRLKRSATALPTPASSPASAPGRAPRTPRGSPARASSISSASSLLRAAPPGRIVGDGEPRQLQRSGRDRRRRASQPPAAREQRDEPAAPPGAGPCQDGPGAGPASIDASPASRVSSWPPTTRRDRLVREAGEAGAAQRDRQQQLEVHVGRVAAVEDPPRRHQREQGEQVARVPPGGVEEEVRVLGHLPPEPGEVGDPAWARTIGQRADGARPARRSSCPNEPTPTPAWIRTGARASAATPTIASTLGWSSRKSSERGCSLKPFAPTASAAAASARRADPRIEASERERECSVAHALLDHPAVLRSRTRRVDAERKDHRAAVDRLERPTCSSALRAVPSMSAPVCAVDVEGRDAKAPQALQLIRDDRAQGSRAAARDSARPTGIVADKLLPNPFVEAGRAEQSHLRGDRERPRQLHAGTAIPMRPSLAA